MSEVKELVPQRKRQVSDEYEMTLREIGDHFGIHRNTIFDIELRALRKFKAEIEKRGYKMEDFFK